MDYGLFWVCWFVVFIWFDHCLEVVSMIMRVVGLGSVSVSFIFIRFYNC